MKKQNIHIHYFVCLIEHLNILGTVVASRARSKELTEPKPQCDDTFLVVGMTGLDVKRTTNIRQQRLNLLFPTCDRNR